VRALDASTGRATAHMAVLAVHSTMRHECASEDRLSRVRQIRTHGLKGGLTESTARGRRNARIYRMGSSIKSGINRLRVLPIRSSWELRRVVVPIDHVTGRRALSDRAG
jgi:hypothetical protein